MGDRTAVAIEIGGNLPRALVAELVEAIEGEGFGLDWNASPPSEEELLAAIKPGEPLRLMDNETYADMGHLATLCETRGLFWRMCWDAYPGSYEAGGQLCDAEGFTEYSCNGTDGEPTLTAREIGELGLANIVPRLERLQRPLPAFVIEGEGGR